MIARKLQPMEGRSGVRCAGSQQGAVEFHETAIRDDRTKGFGKSGPGWHVLALIAHQASGMR
jgi:hypothetical protein